MPGEGSADPFELSACIIARGSPGVKYLPSVTAIPNSAVKMDALHGMGGIGKSVLARALCDDPDVQTAFPDVILWATLGQTPDLVGRLREWIKASSLAPKYMPAVPIGRSSSPSSSARRRCSGCVGGGGFEPRDRSAVPVRAGLDSEPGSGA
jgi:hypothetical protein